MRADRRAAVATILSAVGFRASLPADTSAGNAKARKQKRRLRRTARRRVRNCRGNFSAKPECAACCPGLGAKDPTTARRRFCACLEQAAGCSTECNDEPATR